MTFGILCRESKTMTTTFPPMYRSLVPLDRNAHRELRVRREHVSTEELKSMNSVFLNAVEFADSCREFPIVFVRAGASASHKGKLMPLAVLGLQSGENLFLKDGVWSVEYAPAYLRRYPFAMATIDDGQDLAVCIDDQWLGFSTTEGERIFDDKGEATEFGKGIVAFLENYEAEVQRTASVCDLLDELDILEPMRFEASLADGNKIEVEGFLAVNEEKYQKLEDAKVADLHRRGILQLMEFHRLSMGNMRRLAAKRLSA